MSVRVIRALAVAISLLAATPTSARACLLWDCLFTSPVDYDKPVVVPVYDPRLGPIWTPNGWIYPWPRGEIHAYGPRPPMPYREPRRIDDLSAGHRPYK